jgi:hypothetical protein
VLIPCLSFGTFVAIILALVKYGDKLGLIGWILGVMLGVLLFIAPMGLLAKWVYDKNPSNNK